MLVGCASLTSPKLLSPVSKVALVDVTSNSRIYDVGAQEPETEQGNALGVVKLDPTDQSLAIAEAQLLQALGKAWGGSLVAKDQVLGTKAHRSLLQYVSTVNGVTTLRGLGYKPMGFGDGAIKALAGELGTNGLVTAHFLFQRKLTSGFLGTGNQTAQVTLSVQFYDAVGKKVFEKTYVGLGKSTVGVVAGFYDDMKFVPIIEEASQAAVDLFAADLSAR